MAKVFVSYSRKDINFAKRLTGELKKSDLDFWIDWEGIPPTVDWWKEIEKGIEEADIFLFLISPDSAKSKVCGQEIDYAVQNGKRLIPIVVRTITGDETPVKLKHLNWLFFREEDDYAASLTKLLAAIHTNYEWVQAHRRLQVNALEWERYRFDDSSLLRGKELKDAEDQLRKFSDKDPRPTELQKQYILRSKSVWVRQRRITIAAIAAFLVITGLTVFALFQASEARKQASIARARELGSNAQFIFATRSSQQMSAVLLAIRSLNIMPPGESNETAFSLLTNNHEKRPVATIEHGGWYGNTPPVFSSDGKYVLSTQCNEIDQTTGVCVKSTVRILEISSGKIIHEIFFDLGITYAFFNEDGSRVISFGCGVPDCSVSAINIWEPDTGTENGKIIYNGWITATSPDKKYAAVSNCNRFGENGYCQKGTILILDTQSGKDINHIPIDGWVGSIAFSADNKSLLSTNCTEMDINNYCIETLTRIWSTDNWKERIRVQNNGMWFNTEFNPNGRNVLYAGCDQWSEFGVCSFSSLRVLTASEGTLVQTIPIENSLGLARFSPDGQHILTSNCIDPNEVPSCATNLLRVWTTIGGQEVGRRTFTGYYPNAVFSPDGNYLASTSCDEMDDFGNCKVGSASVWTAIGTDELGKKSHDGNLNYIAFSPDGQYVISGSDDQTAVVWEAATGQEIGRTTHNGLVRFVSFSPDGQYALSTSCADLNCSTFSTQVWAPFGESGVDPVTFANGINTARLSPDGKYLIASGCEELDTNGNCQKSSVRVLDSNSGNETGRMNYSGWVGTAIFSLNGQYVLSTGCDNINCTKSTVNVWEAASGRVVTTRKFDNGIWSADFSPNSVDVAATTCKELSPTGYCDLSTVTIWNGILGSKARQFPVEGNVSYIKFSPDGKHLLATSCSTNEVGIYEDCTVQILTTDTGEETGRMLHKYGVFSAIFSPDGKYVLSTGCDENNKENNTCTSGSARVWSVVGNEEVSRMPHEFGANLAIFNPNGRYVASTGCDELNPENGGCKVGSTKVWEVNRGALVFQQQHDLGVGYVAFSPDGDLLASAGVDGKIFILETDSGGLVSEMSHGIWVNYVAFSPSGNFLVSGSDDKTARVWDVNTGQEVASNLHGSWVSFVAFNPDEKYVLSVSSDIANYWLWKRDDLIAQACETMPRNFNKDEWNTYIGEDEEYQPICPDLPIEIETTPPPTP